MLRVPPFRLDDRHFAGMSLPANFASRRSDAGDDVRGALREDSGAIRCAIAPYAYLFGCGRFARERIPTEAFIEVGSSAEA